MPWYVQDNGKWFGPFTVGDLREKAAKGIIKPEMLIRRDDWEEGRIASEFNDLFPNKVPPQKQVPEQVSGQDPEPNDVHDAAPSPIKNEPVVEQNIEVPDLPKYEDADSSANPFKYDTHLKISACAAGIGLLILAISPLFNWVNFGAGGIVGIRGDGKIVLGVTLFVAILCATVFVIKKSLAYASLFAQAWGMIAFFWMAALFLKVSAILDAPEMEGNPFAALVASQVGPGAGLYLGIIGGLIVVVSFGYIAFRLLTSDNLIPLYASVTISVCLGVVLAIFVGPDNPKPGNEAKPQLAKSRKAVKASIPVAKKDAPKKVEDPKPTAKDTKIPKKATKPSKSVVDKSTPAKSPAKEVEPIAFDDLPILSQNIFGLKLGESLGSIRAKYNKGNENEQLKLHVPDEDEKEGIDAVTDSYYSFHAPEDGHDLFDYVSVDFFKNKCCSIYLGFSDDSTQTFNAINEKLNAKYGKPRKGMLGDNYYFEVEIDGHPVSIRLHKDYDTVSLSYTYPELKQLAELTVEEKKKKEIGDAF
jgi:GYF domain 2